MHEKEPDTAQFLQERFRVSQRSRRSDGLGTEPEAVDPAALRIADGLGGKDETIFMDGLGTFKRIHFVVHSESEFHATLARENLRAPDLPGSLRVLSLGKISADRCKVVLLALGRGTGRAYCYTLTAYLTPNPPQVI